MLKEAGAVQVEPDPAGLKTPAPTRAVPGSPEKLTVLRLRREMGEHLHHPNDLRLSTTRSDRGDDVNADVLGFFRLVRVRSGRQGRRCANNGLSTRRGT